MADQKNGKKRKAAELCKRGCFEDTLTLEQLRSQVAAFADERDWNQFHTPRNLLLALVGEVGELAEIFQWRGEVPKGLTDFKEKDKVAVAEELSDCLSYLVRLADACDIDLAEAWRAKMVKVRKKYPVELCKGKSDKYTAYADAVTAMDEALSSGISGNETGGEGCDASASVAGGGTGVAEEASAGKEQ